MGSEMCIRDRAFDFQCVEQIVPEVHDVPVDYIITEKEMITCRQACQEIR